MNARVFCGNEGLWYWRAQDEHFADIKGEPAHGPFEAAIEAGADARKAIVAAAQRQEITIEDRK